MNLSQEVEECGFFEGYTLQRFVIITAFSAISLFGVLANTVSARFELLDLFQVLPCNTISATHGCVLENSACVRLSGMSRVDGYAHMPYVPASLRS